MKSEQTKSVIMKLQLFFLSYRGEKSNICSYLDSGVWVSVVQPCLMKVRAQQFVISLREVRRNLGYSSLLSMEQTLARKIDRRAG